MDFEQLLPPFVHVASAASLLPDTALLPAEMACVARAVEKRRREFATGRSLARTALAELGIGAAPLLVGKDRSPIWPDGIVGSITHCEGLTVAAVAWRSQLLGLGIDAELAKPLDSDLLPLICSDTEIGWIEQNTPPTPVGWGKLMFCAKEAVYKCVAQLLGRYVGFHEVEVQFDSGASLFTARSAATGHGDLQDMERIDGRYDVGDRFVLATAVLHRT